MKRGRDGGEAGDEAGSTNQLIQNCSRLLHASTIARSWEKPHPRSAHGPRSYFQRHGGLWVRAARGAWWFLYREIPLIESRRTPAVAVKSVRWTCCLAPQEGGV